MIQYFRNIKKDFIAWIEDLSSKQRLIYSIVFVLILIFLVKVVFGIFLNRDESIIKYNEDMSGTFLKYATTYPSNDSYIHVKNATDNFFSLFSETEENDEVKKIDYNRIYDDILYKGYSDYLSKGKFKEKIKKFVEKYENIKSNYNQLIPESILQYKDGFYIVEYSYTINNEIISLWLGVALDTTNSLYYIWYIE